MGKRRRRDLRPGLERVEGRELMSGLIASMAAGTVTRPSASALIARRAIQASASGNPSGANIAGGSAPISTAAGVVSSGGNGLGTTSSPLLGAGQPNAREQVREEFRASFGGRSYQGAGRFSDQTSTMFYRGLGTSNMFLHGDFDMAIVTPTDPTAPFTGEAVLNDKSTNSAGILGLMLTGSRTDVDAKGRPTHLTFTSDPNIYSGAFFVSASTGNVDITYGARNSIKVTFNGRVYTSGLTSPLINQDLYARQGRPVKQR